MLRISLKDLHKNPRAQVLRLLSVAGDLYLIELEIEGQWHRVTDEAGAALQYRSQLAAKKPFKGLGITRALLRHESAYDEMVGLSAEGKNVMEVNIQIPDRDYS